MFDIVLTIFFGVMAIRIATAVRKESAIYREFKQSRALAFLVLLFPLGPFVYVFAMFRLGWLVAFVLATACYIPSLVAARISISGFEGAGTDRVKKAESAANHAFGTAIIGLGYIVLLLAYTLVTVVNSTPGA